MEPRLKHRKNWILWVVVLGLLAALVWFARGRIHFNWAVFVEQLRLADWKLFGIAIALIWLGYLLRAARWAVLMKPAKRVHPISILGCQVIGFTGVALLGRPADLVRPYLVSRRTTTPVAAQIGVYTVERMFDIGSVALIFSSFLLLGPVRGLPRPELIHHAAFGALLAAAGLAAFAVVARMAGHKVAAVAGRMFAAVSPRFGSAVSDKVLAFRDGLSAISSPLDFVVSLAISLVMWAMIAGAYLETCHAFTAAPGLAGLTLSQCILLMAASMVSSTIQLPVIGWFTQIAFTAAAMQALFKVGSEPALACGAMLLADTFLSVIPLGLIWVRFEHVSLKKIAQESEHAGEEVAHHTAPTGQPAELS
jgi:glycosyltransferase 2 family protein